MISSHKINKTVKQNIVIGLERDGVINEKLDKLVEKPKDFIPIQGSIEAITLLRNLGYQIVIITDQRNIEIEKINQVNNYMLNLLGQAGCKSIDGIYFSTNNDKRDIYVKPNVGMFKKCQEENPDINFKNGFYVGNSLDDIKAALKIKSRPILVRTGKGSSTEKKLNMFMNNKLKVRTYVFDNLYEFAQAL